MWAVLPPCIGPILAPPSFLATEFLLTSVLASTKMAFTNNPKSKFFPSADTTLLSGPSERPILPNRPKIVHPAFDPEQLDDPLTTWATDAATCIYPPKHDPFAPASIPNEPTLPSSRYLRACLAPNERLRLSMLWYYAQDLDSNPDFLTGLQEKACLAQESSGWEYAVIGILDVNVYIRLATVGLDLAILPRGETLCAHTVTQPPGVCILLQTSCVAMR